MNWCVAVLTDEDSLSRRDFSLHAMYIEAENRYEALGKAQAVANKLWPGTVAHVNALPADIQHLITDPSKVEITTST